MRVKQTPTVSVVIPAYNSASFLGQAVQSVLEQTHRCDEVIVVDDGSTDNTKDTLLRFEGRIKYLYQQNRGPAAARNTGIKIAQGDYICFLDADDLWTPNKLEEQIAFIQRNSEIGLVFSDEAEIGGNGTIYKSLLSKSKFYPDIVLQLPVREAFRKLLEENFIPTSTVMVRKQCLAKAGLFDENLGTSEDRDLWSRIAAYFPIACLPLVLGKKRDCQFSVSKNVESTHQSRIKVWKKSRRLFPDLAPAPVVDHLLAQTYLELGYLFLAQDRRKEALMAGLNSLKHALRNSTPMRSPGMELDPYPWSLGTGLIVFTFTGYSIARALGRTRAALMRRNCRAAESKNEPSSISR